MGGGGSGDHTSESVWDRMKANIETGGEAGVGCWGKKEEKEKEREERGGGGRERERRRRKEKKETQRREVDWERVISPSCRRLTHASCAMLVHSGQ